MKYEGEDNSPSVPLRRVIPHYFGDTTRVLFVAAAVILIVAKSTGADVPLSTTVTVVVAAVLVVTAGVTNPAQKGIHWLNAVLSAAGTLLFGVKAIEHYQAGMGLFDGSFMYIEILALLSLIALYNTTRTIRGIYLKAKV